MPVLIRNGHSLTGLAPLAVDLRIEREVDYTTEFTADGVARPTGGASAVLAGDTLDDDELAALMAQLGFTLEAPSVLVTVVLPDKYRTPTPWYGVATLAAPERRAWWNAVRVDLTGLVRAT